MNLKLLFMIGIFVFFATILASPILTHAIILLTDDHRGSYGSDAYIAGSYHGFNDAMGGLNNSNPYTGSMADGYHDGYNSGLVKLGHCGYLSIYSHPDGIETFLRSDLNNTWQPIGKSIIYGYVLPVGKYYIADNPYGYNSTIAIVKAGDSTIITLNLSNLAN